MLDGLEIAEGTHVVALGISTDGVKIPLGLWEGSDRERDLGVDAAGRPRRPQPRPGRGDPACDRRRAGAAPCDQGRVGEHALVHRCHRDKERNVCDLLPERDRHGIQVRNRGTLGARPTEHLARCFFSNTSQKVRWTRTRPDATPHHYARGFRTKFVGAISATCTGEANVRFDACGRRRPRARVRSIESRSQRHHGQQRERSPGHTDRAGRRSETASRDCSRRDGCDELKL